MVARRGFTKRGRGRPKKNVVESITKVGSKDTECFFCHNPVTTDADTESVLCSTCTGRLAGSPEAIGKGVVKAVVKSEAAGKKDWPRCWWLKKKFTAPDGSKWKKGKMVSPAPTKTKEAKVTVEA